MKKIVILKGLPGSGKTTYARKWIEVDPSNRVRVNRDDIRRQLGPYWIPSREKLVTEIENDMIIKSLNNNYNVIIDATNLNPNYSSKFKDLRDFYNIEIIEHFIDTPLKTCIQRDQQRENPVGKDVIMRLYNKYLKKE